MESIAAKLNGTGLADAPKGGCHPHALARGDNERHGRERRGQALLELRRGRAEQQDEDPEENIERMPFAQQSQKEGIADNDV